MRRVSGRRAALLPTYAALRDRFLAAHPYCQVWLAENGLTEADVRFALAVARKEWGDSVCIGLPQPCLGLATVCAVPMATEIHHANKRRGARLTDTAHWLAVCRRMHALIERNKSWARDRGYLRNF
jgi:hypothetical protein